MKLKPESAREWISVGKDVILILVGVFIIIHETVGYDPPSQALLIVAGACIGLPLYSRFKSANGKPPNKEGGES